MREEYISNFDREINILRELLKHNDTPSIQMLLNREIQYKENIRDMQKTVLEKISNNEIYSRLYIKLLNGKKASEAVSEVVSENYYNNIKPSSESSVWRYYIKLKKLIK